MRYKSALSAKRATDELATGVEIRGKAVSVLPAEDNDTLFLGNISKDWTKEQVWFLKSAPVCKPLFMVYKKWRTRSFNRLWFLCSLFL